LQQQAAEQSAQLPSIGNAEINYDDPLSSNNTTQGRARWHRKESFWMANYERGEEMTYQIML